MNYAFRFAPILAVLAFPVAPPLVAQGARVDQQVAAISQEIAQHNYFKAAALVAALEKQTQASLGTALAPGRSQQAMMACSNEQDISGALARALVSFQKGDWEDALYSFTSARFGLAKLTADTGAEEKFTRDKAVAQTQSSPAWWHQAAITALNAGHLPESLDDVNREIASTPKSYPARAYSLLLHRAYTLRESLN